MSRIRTRLLRLERQAANRPECPECSPEGGQIVFTVRPPRVLGEDEPFEPECPPPTPCRRCGRVQEPLVFTVRPPRAIGAGSGE